MTTFRCQHPHAPGLSALFVDHLHLGCQLLVLLDRLATSLRPLGCDLGVEAGEVGASQVPEFDVAEFGPDVVLDVVGVAASRSHDPHRDDRQRQPPHNGRINTYLEMYILVNQVQIERPLRSKVCMAARTAAMAPNPLMAKR
ncbi:hypothetical protein QLQ12_29795 [Actinoplanes sp. NEAU-A12]|uniref:Uncharacterized protein n=1 Tax=Actinoplanes sandaracinus TaxID=3045177 RepID=A0ABT6WSW1_9ACTN|nr:hypothetical protein [Actinoplanes sandaracinus]MDI6102819.1 hypothetical protein [Actinoplanes sandaracinus]